MSCVFTLEYEHTWPTECWPDGRPIWGVSAGKPTGQRLLLDVQGVRNHAHALAIVRADASPGFGTILHEVTPQSDEYASRGFRKKGSS